MVIYIGSKKVKELLEKLFLEDVPFPTLFPTKYYTEPENGMNLINDIFQREPILKLTPYLENVLTMKKQNKIHTLIIDQIKTIEGQQSLFERLLSDEKVGNILFLDWLENQEKVNLLKNYDFKVKKFYPDIINIRNRQSSSTTSYSSQNEYSYHKIYISNLQNLKHFILTPSINEITFLKEYIYYEEKIKLNLEYLGKSIYENKFLSDLNNLTYSILFHLRSAPDFYDEEFIDSYFDSLFLSIKATYEKLKDYCNKKQQVSLEKILELIVKLIYSEAFRELSLIKRMKILDICNLYVNKDKRIAIVTKRKKEVLIIQNLCSRTKHRISFFTFKEYVRDNNNIFDAILLTFYPRKSIEDLWVNGKTDTIYYFLYPDEIKLFKNVYLSELNKHSYIEKQEFKFPELIEDFKTPIDYDYEQTKDYSKESSVNSILNEQIKKNYNEEEAKRHKALYVEFIEGYYAFLTEKYHCHLINRNEEKIENRTIELLEIGDEIGFLNDPDDHLLEKYLSLKFESDNSWAENYKKISNRADYWRKKLLIYQKKNGISLENLRKELKAFGCKRTIHTIKRWFNDKKMYAPRQDAIIAIGKLLQDEKILNNVDKIIASAEKKKKLHQKIRSRIEDFAVNSVFNSNYVGNTIIRKMTDDIKKRFFQVEISYISSDYRDVPSYLINKLISN
ncbi:DrmE family protein [Tepidibacillus infernus]|uniref:DrmE family protein n=1 Tax=Tepidibacillus infernus TaxID=1806172 RepID=UPI003B7207B7